MLTTLITLLLCSATSRAFLFDTLFNRAEMYPEDVTLFLGDRLQMWCQLKGEGINTISISDVYLKVFSPNGNHEVPLTTINATHGYSVITAIEDIGGTNTVSCMSDESLLYSTFLNVERELQNVTLDYGVWDYSHNKVRINWNLGQNYFLPNHLRISSEWNANAPPKLAGNQCSESGRDHCIIENFLHISVLCIRVTVEPWNVNSFRDTRRQAYVTTASRHPLRTVSDIWVVPMFNVKPGRPRQLNVSSEGEGCMTASWVQPLYFVDFGADSAYNVITTSFDSVESSWASLFNASLAASEDCVPSPRAGQVTHCHLPHGQRYKMCVRVKPVSNGHWSDFECGSSHL